MNYLWNLSKTFSILNMTYVPNFSLDSNLLYKIHEATSPYCLIKRWRRKNSEGFLRITWSNLGHFGNNHCLECWKMSKIVELYKSLSEIWPKLNKVCLLKWSNVDDFMFWGIVTRIYQSPDRIQIRIYS